MIYSAKEIITQLLSRKGQNTKISWKSKIKPAAKFKTVSIEKVVTAVVRSGIDFQNLSSVKSEIESGERTEVNSLPWGKWEQFPYIISHNDKKYVRLYPASSANQIPKTRYFVDGKEVTKSKVLQYLTAGKVKELTEAREVKCFTVTEDNILSIEK